MSRPGAPSGRDTGARSRAVSRKASTALPGATLRSARGRSGLSVIGAFADRFADRVPEIRDPRHPASEIDRVVNRPLGT